MRFANIVVAYFVVGALMWGAGVISWQQAGIGGMFIDQNPNTDRIEVNGTTSQDLKDAGGPIRQAANTVTGGLLAIWNLMVRLIGFLTWPITVAQSVAMPPRLVVMLGGTPTVAFFATLLRVIRGT